MEKRNEQIIKVSLFKNLPSKLKNKIHFLLKRPVFKKLILVIIGLFLSLVFLEIFLRVFKPQITFSNIILPYDFRCFKKGNYHSLDLIPNKTCKLKSNFNQFKETEVRINSLGLRNPEIVIPKPKDTTRILFIGDSYTMGWGVDEKDAYPRVASNKLKELLIGKKIEGINAGLAATGPNYYYLYLKNEGLQLQPDVIVVGIYILNDIADNAYNTRWLEVDNNGLPTKVESNLSFADFSGYNLPVNFPLKYKVPFLRDSHLFVALNDIFAPPKVEVNDHVLSPRECLYKKSCTYLDDAKAKTKKLIQGIKDLADTNNAQVLIVLTPSEFQFDRKARLKNGIRVPLLPSDRDRPYNELKTYFDQNKIDYLDLRPAFREHGVEHKYYFELDDHWNELGHEVAAEAISQKLKDYIPNQSQL